MSREIKFRIRVFSPKDNYHIFEYHTLEQISNGSLKTITEVGGVLKEKDLYTGKKDKNGKEIYDGDIVMINDYYTEHITDDGQGPQEEFNHLSEVVFNNGMFGVDIKEKGDIYYPGFHSFGVLDDESEELEVIGNIYENPELINKNIYAL